MKTEHTALPWHVGMKPGPMIYGTQGECVADLRIETNIPNENGHNAAFIVRACNNFEELLEACREALTHMDDLELLSAPNRRKLQAAQDTLTAAIRKAEEE